MNYIVHPLIRENTIETREYQESLVNAFLEKGNSLVVAPTALGKTIIAAQIIAKVIENSSDKKILFLAPTKPLAVQHINTLKKILNLDESEMTVLTGAVTPDKRAELWKARIIAATPQTIENDIINSSAVLENTALIIFDEAHRAVKGYSYVFIAEQYLKKNNSGKILALTASPGSTREKIQEICSNLFIKNVEMKSEKDEDVKSYVFNKKIDWVRIDLPEEFEVIKRNIESFMEEKVQILKEFGIKGIYGTRTITKRQMIAIQNYLMKQENKTTESFNAIAVTAMIIKASYILELLETQNTTIALKYFKKLGNEKTRSAKRILEDIRMQKAFVELENLEKKNVEHPKLKMLSLIVKEEMNIGNRIIIFTHYREMSDYIMKKLEKENIKSEKFIGQATKGVEKGLTQKEQIETIERFKNNEFQVLICTSVGEEGLDIPSVDTVIFYEPVSSAIRYIQRKGRTGRHKEGKIIILMTKNTRDEAYYWSSINNEKKMKTLINEMSKTGLNIEEKQKTITSYSSENTEEKEDNPIIYVDSRERSSGIVKILLNKNAQIKAENLEVADYLLSDRVAVERKEANDFITSLINGRLFTQVGNLKRNFERPLIIIEGELTGIRNISQNAIMGAISAITIDYGIPIIQTKSAKETGEMLYFIAYREQFSEKREVKLQGEKKAMGIKEQQQFIIESLPEIGPTSAKSLLKHFNSVEKVIIATEKELKEAGGIGEKRAKEIKRVITEKYNDE